MISFIHSLLSNTFHNAQVCIVCSTLTPDIRGSGMIESWYYNTIQMYMHTYPAFGFEPGLMLLTQHELESTVFLLEVECSQNHRFPMDLVRFHHRKAKCSHSSFAAGVL